MGGGRNAALVHTAPDGRTDLPLGDDTRVYFLTGAQHGPARFPTRVNQGQQPDNPLEYWWTMRALMVAMEKWVNDGVAPPASQYPKLSDGTLVAADPVAFRLAHMKDPRARAVSAVRGEQVDDGRGHGIAHAARAEVAAGTKATTPLDVVGVIVPKVVEPDETVITPPVIAEGALDSKNLMPLMIEPAGITTESAVVDCEPTP